MKGIHVIVGAALMLTSLVGFANTDAVHKTDMHKNWTCMTNASSSDVKADQDADKKMSTAGSVDKNFKEAKKHCRDCTKITCESTQ